MAYLTPIRLFIFLMFVFFAVLSFQNYDQFLMNTNNDFDAKQYDNGAKLSNSDDFNLLEQNYAPLRYDRLIRQLNHELNEQKQQEQAIVEEIMQKNGIEPDSTELQKNNGKQEALKQIENLEKAIISLQDVKARIDLKKEESVYVTLFFDHQYQFNIHDLNNLSPQQLIDQYHINHWLEKIIVKQYLKLNKDHRAFGRFIFQNFTWVVIIEVLLMSLFFKLFYFRSKRKYVEFFVFHLHLRSFLFLVGICTFIFPYDLNNWVITALFCLIGTYLLLSMKRVFNQSWPMTGLKFFSLSVVEMVVFLLSFLMVVISSSLIY